jgi:hypothetical protein
MRYWVNVDINYIMPTLITEIIGETFRIGVEFAH